MNFLKCKIANNNLMKQVLTGGIKMIPFKDPFNSSFNNFMFDVFPVIFTIMFITIFGLIIFSMIKGVGQWKYNNSQPVLTVTAKLVSKRTNVSRSTTHHGDDFHHHSHTSTTYYITFEVESGDRMELCVSGEQYGLLVEGDRGQLTFQGTRYLAFKREVNGI